MMMKLAILVTCFVSSLALPPLLNILVQDMATIIKRNQSPLLNLPSVIDDKFQTNPDKCGLLTLNNIALHGHANVGKTGISKKDADCAFKELEKIITGVTNRPGAPKIDCVNVKGTYGFCGKE